MIRISLTCNCIEARGHAEDKYICNTVSALLWSLAMCLDVSAKVTEGDGYQKITHVPTHRTMVTWYGMRRCLSLLSKEFPNEVEIIWGSGLENEKEEVITSEYKESQT